MEERVCSPSQPFSPPPIRFRRENEALQTLAKVQGGGAPGGMPEISDAAIMYMDVPPSYFLSYRYISVVPIYPVGVRTL